MSKFFSARHARLEAYTPGEQPQNRKYIKLNTNESPFPPSPGVVKAAEEAAGTLQLYSDPTAKALNQKAAEHFGLKPEQLLFTNGSDEILAFAFLAFGDEAHPFAFPDITYGFYPVFGDLYHVPVKIIPLTEDLRINPADYYHLGCNIVIANPNAPTGLALKRDEIEEIIKTNPDNIVVVDEAYVDFGAESCLPLINKYDNLIVTRTYSKFMSLAGARLGFGAANEALIADMNTIKYSSNPYNVNRMTMAAGIAALEEVEYYRQNGQTIQENREYTKEKLRELGFTVTDSRSNFLFAKHPALDGKKYYLALKDMGILIRHFDTPLICQYNRITVGTKEQMDAFLAATETILKNGGSL